MIKHLIIYCFTIYALFVAYPSISFAQNADTLTDNRTFATWAHPELQSSVRSFPNIDAKIIARLHYKTEDGYPEVYAAYRRFVDSDGRVWIKIGIPMRPNGRQGWVREYSLGPLYRVHTRLIINKTTLRANLFRSGKLIWSSKIGVGANSTPTPSGNYWVREKFKIADAGGIYGPRAFGTSSYSTLSDWPGGGVIGIHGTNQPNLLPGRVSHGCIRIPNSAIIRLYDLMAIGTPVIIR